MEMDKKLRAIFSQIEEHHCFETISDSEFYIYDSGEKQRCFILSDETNSTNIQLFKVINHNNQNIRFLAVDKCLFFDSDKLKRCDCILYNEEYLCFVEIKKVDTASSRLRKYWAKTTETVLREYHAKYFAGSPCGYRKCR
jgi:hypothetical protein